MKCRNCGFKNGSVKRTCEHCEKFLVGYCFNNVTAEFGFRDEKGIFTPCGDLLFDINNYYKIEKACEILNEKNR